MPHKTVEEIKSEILEEFPIIMIFPMLWDRLKHPKYVFWVVVQLVLRVLSALSPLWISLSILFALFVALHFSLSR